MSAVNTRGAIRSLARLYCDQRKDVFVSDDEIDVLTNLKIRHLYDLLVQARGAEYFAAEHSFSTAPGVSRYALPADFYQLNSVTLEWSPTEHELVDMVQSARGRAAFTGQGFAWSQDSPKGYRLRSQQLELLPTPTAEVACVLQYVPAFSDLASDSASFDFVNGWEKMVALGVAIELLAIDKRASSTLSALYQEELDRIEAMKTERDAEVPKEVIDVSPDGCRGVRPWNAPPWDDSFERYFG